jgi:hypothetical protein
MAIIEILGDELVVRVHGIERFLALKSELRVPLSHVVGAERAADEAHRWFHGFRAGGTNIPGLITAGTFFAHEGHTFWDVRDADRAIAIRLHDDAFVKIVIGVEDPDAAIALVRAAIALRSGSPDQRSAADVA